MLPDRKNSALCDAGVIAALVGCIASLSITATAEDWPQWRGKDRDGVWLETGIVKAFPAEGLEVVWRAPVKAGYTGPAVADGRVFVTDYEATDKAYAGIERALAFDEETGEQIWATQWETDYKGMLRSWAIGPRSTPTVDGDRVYVFGAAADLLCLNAETGEIIWQTNFQKDNDASIPIWGFAGAPLVDGDLLICLAGAEPDGKVMALDKMTGKEIWRAISTDQGAGYSAPMIVEAGGARQLISWHPRAITALDPASGKILWEQPFRVKSGLSVMTPVSDGSRLFVSAFYDGPMMIGLDEAKPGGEILWRGDSDSERQTDKLHCMISTPVLDGDHLYGICSYGHLRCLDAKTGDRIWETLKATRLGRWSNAHIVAHEDRYFINNEMGDLIIAKLSPAGYDEISRTKIIEPTTPAAIGNREDRPVNWVHPAYANRRLIIRNDVEMISYSMAE